MDAAENLVARFTGLFPSDWTNFHPNTLVKSHFQQRNGQAAASVCHENMTRKRHLEESRTQDYTIS